MKLISKIINIWQKNNRKKHTPLISSEINSDTGVHTSFIIQYFTSAIATYFLSPSFQGKQLHCYLPKSQFNTLDPYPLLKNKLVLHELPVVAAPKDNSVLNYYKIAEDIIAPTVEGLKTHLPDFFKLKEYDVENLFRYQYQLELSTTDIEFLKNVYNFLNDFNENIESDPLEKPLFLDFKYLLDESCPWILEALKYPKSMTFPWHNTLYSTLTESSHFHQYIDNLGTSFESIDSGSSGLENIIDLNTSSSQPIALIFLSLKVHLQIMTPAIKTLANTHHFIFLLTGSSDFTPSFLESLETYNPVAILHFNSLKPSLKHLSLVTQHFRKITEDIQHLSVSIRKKVFLFGYIPSFLNYLYTLCILERVIDESNAKLVLGCMELNMMGPAFSILQQKYSFQTINFQHGNMNPIASFYLFQFDLYFIWNEISKKVLLKDGYTNPSGLEIVGSPFLDKMITEKNNYIPSVLFQELQAWKGSDKLITAYSTFQATHLTVQNKLQFMESLVGFLKQSPNLKLLIKKHPYEEDDVIATYLETEYEGSPELRNQIKLFSASEITLLESLLLSNLATSICSTVLQEALYLKILAVALDFENIHELIGLEERFVYPVITEPTRVIEELNQYLTEDDSLNSFPGFKPERFELLFPKFTTNYEERIQSVLQKYKFAQQIPIKIST